MVAQKVDAVQKKAEDDGVVPLALDVGILVFERFNERIREVRGTQGIVCQGCIFQVQIRSTSIAMCYWYVT